MNQLNVIAWFCIIFIDVTKSNNVCTTTNDQNCSENHVSDDAKKKYSKCMGGY